MGFRDMPGPVRVFWGMVAWAVILWLFTLGNPSFIPAAKFLFIVLVLPNGLAEWLKDKGVTNSSTSIFARIILMIGAGLIWYFYYR
jgi:hypothetical protein